MTDGQSASLSWCQAPIWGTRPDFYYCLTAAGLLMWGVLSDVKMGLSFVVAAGPHQRSHIYCLWTLAAILLHEFWYNFCDGHYSVLFWLGPIELCHDLLKYHCNYLEHVVQRQTVCIRSLNWLTWYLLLFVSQERRGGHSFLPLWWGRPVQLKAAEAAAVAVCFCVALSWRIDLGRCGWKRTPFPL
jgi:hypothetical protein